MINLATRKNSITLNSQLPGKWQQNHLIYENSIQKMECGTNALLALLGKINLHLNKNHLAKCYHIVHSRVESLVILIY